MLTFREVAAYSLPSALEPRSDAIQFSPDGNTLTAVVTHGVQLWRAASLEESDLARTSRTNRAKDSVQPPKPTTRL